MTTKIITVTIPNVDEMREISNEISYNMYLINNGTRLKTMPIPKEFKWWVICQFI